MNQLYQFTALLAKALFKKDSPIVPDNAFPETSEPGIVLKRLRQLAEEGKVNTAENLLFDSFDKKKPYFIAIGLDFYARISEFTDEALRESDFSREEIQEGIGDMLKFYGIKIAVRPNAPSPAAQAARNAANVAPNVMADKPKKI